MRAAAAEDALPDGPFTVEDAERRGIGRNAVARLALDGKLDRLARGLYQRVDSEPSDTALAEAALRAPNATICLATALARHGLVDYIPSRIDLALPRGQHRPATHAPISWHAFDVATFHVGRTRVDVEGTDLQVGLYSAERSIVDAFRLQHVEGYELAIEALRTWLRRPGAHPVDLLQVAEQIPRATRAIRNALVHLA